MQTISSIAKICARRHLECSEINCREPCSCLCLSRLTYSMVMRISTSLRRSCLCVGGCEHQLYHRMVNTVAHDIVIELVRHGAHHYGKRSNPRLREPGRPDAFGRG